MQVLRTGSVSLLFLMIAVSGFAQSTPAAQPEAATPAAPAANPQVRRRNHGPLCWKQAGLTPDMVNQRWKIEDQQKTTIASVCSETTTSAQQKHDKIEQIHANTGQAMSKLIPADKLAKFNKCEADLEKSRPAPASQKQLGPCGGTIPTPAASGMEHHDGMQMNQ